MTRSITTVAGLLRAPLMRSGAPLPMQIRLTSDGSATRRWSLGRRWGSGLRLPWIMLNPSTADDGADDPTLRRVIAFSWLWGFDGALVFNLFPFRSPHPSNLAAWVREDRYAPSEIKDGWTIIARAIEWSDAAMVAWGCPPGRIHYETQIAAENLFDEINGFGCSGDRSRVLKVFCLGKTGGGFPTHPMARGKHRVPNDARPIEFTPYPGTIVGLDRDIEARA